MQSLREYEFTYTLSGELPDNERSQKIDHYEKVLLGEEGQIINKEDWGVRKLAYPMKKVFRGHYVHYDFVTTPEHLLEAERLMRIDDHVLRHLVVKLKEKAPDTEERKKEINKLKELKEEQATSE